MKYTIKTHKKVDKFLEKHREIAKKYIFSIKLLSEDPYSTKLDTKELSNNKWHFRSRIWKYRFLYEIINN